MKQWDSNKRLNRNRGKYYLKNKYDCCNSHAIYGKNVTVLAVSPRSFIY